MCQNFVTLEILLPWFSLTLSQMTNFRLFQTEGVLQMPILSLMKIVEGFLKGFKILWKKKKLLIMSNFFFSHSVFKIFVLQTRKNQGLFGKGLIHTCTMNIGVKGEETLNINPLPGNKISDQSKLKALADNKLDVTQNIKLVFHIIENIAGKEENAGYQHFLLFPQCFQKAFSSSTTKVVIV